MLVRLNFEVETSGSYPSSPQKLAELLTERAESNRFEGIETVRFFKQPSNVDVYLLINKDHIGAINGVVAYDTSFEGSSEKILLNFEFNCDCLLSVYRVLLLFIYNMFYDVLLIKDIDSFQEFAPDYIERFIVRSDIMNPVRVYGVENTHMVYRGIMRTVGLTRFGMKDVGNVYDSRQLNENNNDIHEILNAVSVSCLYNSKIQDGMTMIVGEDVEAGVKLSIVLTPSRSSSDYDLLSPSLQRRNFDTLLVNVVPPREKNTIIRSNVRGFAWFCEYIGKGSFAVITPALELQYMKGITTYTATVAKDKASRGEDITIFAVEGPLYDMTPEEELAANYHPSGYDEDSDMFVCCRDDTKILIAPKDVFWWQYRGKDNKTISPVSVVGKVYARERV